MDNKIILEAEMKIGVVRHFKVDTDRPENLKQEEYIGWLKKYDRLDVIESQVDLREIDWNKCYVSTLPRAIKTAETIYDGEIIKSNKIVEVNLKFRESIAGEKSIREWGNISIENWEESTGISGEDRFETEDRVNKFLDILEGQTDAKDNILIVCHELIMTVIDEKLRERGFKGETASKARNGELFLFER